MENKPTEKEEWVSVEDRKPVEADNQILVTNGNGLCEIVWVCDKDEDNDDLPSLKKPFAYNKYDTPCHTLETITHWMPLPSPPNK